MLQQTKVEELTSRLTQIGDSDLHLKVGHRRWSRCAGYSIAWGIMRFLHTVDTEDVLKADNLADNFEEEREVDFS